MVFGHVQAGEVVVVVLDLGAFVNLKAHAGEHINDLVFHQRDGMQPAAVMPLGRQGDVHRLGLVAGGQRRLLHLLGQCLVLPLRPGLELVDGLAYGGTVLLGHVTQVFGQPRHRAVFAQVLLPEGGKLVLVLHAGHVGLQRGAQLLDFFFHTCTSYLSGQKQKAPSPELTQGRD